MKLGTIGRVARNSIAVSAALLIKRATHFALYILIARHLGVEAFGQFSLAYTFFIIFQVSAVFGLANLIVREVAKNKADFGKYLINGHLIVLIASLASLGIWALLVHLLGYSSHVIQASYLLAISLIPFAMCRVCEAIFQAFERMQFMTYAFGITSIMMIGMAWLLLSRGFGLMPVITLLLAVQVLMLLIEWYFMWRYFPRPSWTLDLAFCRKLAKVSTTFFGIGVFTVIFLRLNVIVLSKFRGEAEVGLYNAAFQLTYFFMLISMSFKEAIFPVLSRTYITNLAKFKGYAERSVEFLMSIGLPLAVCFFFLADVVLLVYRKDFVAAAPVMRVLCWMLIPLSFNRILGSVLIAGNQQRANLGITIVNTFSLLVLSILFIKYFGVIGAGVALLCSHVISGILHYGLVVKKVFPFSIPKVIWKPVVASLFLVGLFLIMGKTPELSVLVPLAIILYTGVLLALNFLFGGPLKSMRVGVLLGKTESGIPEPEI